MQVPCIDLVQGPGETIFVPSGWWHVILNMDLTMAVTQNFASSRNFKYVWPEAAKSRPRFAAGWLSALEQEGNSALSTMALSHLRAWDSEGVQALPPLSAGGARRVALRALLLKARWRRRAKRKQIAEYRESFCGLGGLVLKLMGDANGEESESTSDSDSSPSESEEDNRDSQTSSSSGDEAVVATGLRRNSKQL